MNTRRTSSIRDQSTEPGRNARLNLRRRIAAAVRMLANGVDERKASARTRAFYRSSGMEWSRFLQ
jgi:hypothetical protein